MMNPWPFFSKKFLPFVFLLGYFFVTWTSVTAIDPQVLQTDSLDFVQKEHRGHVQQILGEMHIHVNRELPQILKEKPPLTLLSCASLLLFKGNEPLNNVQAHRDSLRQENPTIFMGKKEISASPLIFCANHRAQLKNKTIQEAIVPLRKKIVPDKGRPSDEEVFTILLEFQRTIDLNTLDQQHRNLFTEMESRQEFLKNQLRSDPGPLEKILQLSKDESDAEKISSYVAAHIDDGEGAAVDALLQYLRDPDFCKAFQDATSIYPLVYTERDPCRCCLISIRDYLTRELRNVFPSPSLQITPIVLSNGIYNEQSPDTTVETTLRYHYLWWPPETLQEADESGKSSLGVSSDSEDMDSEVESTQPPLPTIFLYHMPLRQMVQLKTERK